MCQKISVSKFLVNPLGDDTLSQKSSNPSIAMEWESMEFHSFRQQTDKERKRYAATLFFCKSAMTMVELKVTSCFWRWLHDHVTAAYGRRSLPLRWAATLSRQRKPPLRGSVGWVAPSLVLKKVAWQNEVKQKMNECVQQKIQGWMNHK